MTRRSNQEIILKRKRWECHYFYGDINDSEFMSLRPYPYKQLTALKWKTKRILNRLTHFQKQTYIASLTWWCSLQNIRWPCIPNWSPLVNVIWQVAQVKHCTWYTWSRARITISALLIFCVHRAHLAHCLTLYNLEKINKLIYEIISNTSFYPNDIYYSIIT